MPLHILSPSSLHSTKLVHYSGDSNTNSPIQNFYKLSLLFNISAFPLGRSRAIAKEYRRMNAKNDYFGQPIGLHLILVEKARDAVALEPEPGLSSRTAHFPGFLHKQHSKPKH